MKLTLTRLDYTDSGVFGHLVCDGFDCVTLERDDTLIPDGTYRVTRYESPRFKTTVLLLHDVPGRSYIEIHPADYEKELKGCIAVAKRRTGLRNLDKDVFARDNNKKTFDELMKHLETAIEMEIQIR